MEKYDFYDRAAVKTNAFEWLLTIPNAAVEFDVVRTPFRKMSLNLGVKYNWNTYHKSAPAAVFDLFDFRPEFRFYFRTRNLKVSRPWWVMYVGPYASHGTYTFKLSRKGIRGYASGAGISAGYVIPMYEYAKGAIDVELGASVGVQYCTKEVFTHNPEGNYYTKQEEESVGPHVTPFPVLSELKVAFVWRNESIRHQVRIDTGRAERKALYKKKLGLMIEDIDAHIPMDLCGQFRTIDELDRELAQRKDDLVGDKYIRSSFYSFSPRTIRTLERRISARVKEVRRAFRRSQIK
jgi:hypothetical protein